MSKIRCIYYDAAPAFPATDQHPDAMRYGPLALPSGGVVFVDAIGSAPTADEIAAVLNPPAPPQPTPAQKLAAAGLTVAELKELLALPT